LSTHNRAEQLDQFEARAALRAKPKVPDSKVDDQRLAVQPLYHRADLPARQGRQ
jgi:hypothetical protein